MNVAQRISATDWLEESLKDEPSWTSLDTVKLAKIIFEHGVDFLDVSSGGNHIAQKIDPLGSGKTYQARFAADVKEAGVKMADGKKHLMVGCVGGITTGHIAQGLLEKGVADVALVGRQFLKNPNTVWAFAQDLNVDIHQAPQFSREGTPS